MTVIEEKNYRNALVELNIILSMTSDDLVSKIPKNMRDFFKRNQSSDYEANIDTSLPINEQQLLPKTKSLMAMIYRYYFCNEVERKEYDEILSKNQQKYDEEIKEKLDPFKNIEISKTQQEEQQSVPILKGTRIEEANSLIAIENKNIFKRIFEKIKNFFIRNEK